MTIATFTVKRSELRQGGRGEFKRGDGYTGMRNEEGLMCCLGAIGLACGIPPEAMLNKDMPSSVCDGHPEYRALPHMELFVDECGSSYYDSQLAEDAAEINDDETRTHAERETDLIALFKKHECELIFVD